jgi:hypothetical protein
MYKVQITFNCLLVQQSKDLLRLLMAWFDTIQALVLSLLKFIIVALGQHFQALQLHTNTLLLLVVQLAGITTVVAVVAQVEQ